MNNNLLIGGIFCDLEKAFDCVNHKILLTKLEFYGITGNHYKLFESYLMDRYQRTILCNENGNFTTSTWSKVEHGVPQGSIFGPLLFLIFISDLPKFINDQSIPILFADDTNILVSHPNILVFYKTINTVFQTLNDWFKHNLLSLNLTKLTLLILYLKKNQLVKDTEYDNKSTSAVTYTKFLGLTVNCLLTWTDHIDLLAKKLSSTCYLI